MSKHRKHRKEPVAASQQVLLNPDTSVAQTSSRTRRMVWQLAGVLGASVVLGFAFNASSPVGVRFLEAKPTALSASTAATNQPAPTPVAVAAVTNRVVVRPPSPPPPIQQQLVRRSTNPPPPVTAAPAPAATTVALSSPQLPVATALSPTPFAPPPVTVAASNAPPAAPNPAPIHWTEAKPLVEAGQGVLVDVRHKSMYDAGHIPGAISLPETSPPQEFEAFLNQHPTNITLIVYCSSVSCSQSARVANRLVTQYQRPSVKFMTGGYMEYQQAELAKNPAQPTP